jgi:hypothetical protein
MRKGSVNSSSSFSKLVHLPVLEDLKIEKSYI